LSSRHNAGLLKTPGSANISSSPLPPSPATPIPTRELKQGAHEMIGLIRRKIVFAKRPEPVTKVVQPS